MGALREGRVAFDRVFFRPGRFRPPGLPGREGLLCSAPGRGLRGPLVRPVDTPGHSLPGPAHPLDPQRGDLTFPVNPRHRVKESTRRRPIKPDGRFIYLFDFSL